MQVSASGRGVLRRFENGQAAIGLDSALVVRHKLANPPDLPQETVHRCNRMYSIQHITILTTYINIYL